MLTEVVFTGPSCSPALLGFLLSMSWGGRTPHFQLTSQTGKTTNFTQF